jgi:hypothetical protein
MALNSIALSSLRRRNALEWVATMQAQGDGEPASLSGQEVVESFGMPRIYGQMLLDRDLRPELVSAHRGHARYVLEVITAGRAGTFRVDPSGRFEDFHGGHGFRSGSYLNWFTPQALARGIGWYFEQTYRCNSRVVGRFQVIRIISSGSGVEVRKVRLGT